MAGGDHCRCQWPIFPTGACEPRSVAVRVPGCSLASDSSPGPGPCSSQPPLMVVLLVLSRCQWPPAAAALAARPIDSRCAASCAGLSDSVLLRCPFVVLYRASDPSEPPASDTPAAHKSRASGLSAGTGPTGSVSSLPQPHWHWRASVSASALHSEPALSDRG